MNRARMQIWLIMTLLVACREDDQSRRIELRAEPVPSPEQQAEWRAELVAAREEKDLEFASSATSPMAGTQYLKSEPAEIVFLSRAGRVLDLAYDAGPGAVLSMTLRDNAWHWVALVEGVVCERDGEEIASGEAVNGPATFSIDDLAVSFYSSEDRVTFIVFDSTRKEMQSFERLLYFDPDPAFVVEAELVPLPDPETITVPTSRDLEKTFYRYATIRFEIDGEPQQLTALKSALEGPSSEGLFIPFRDGTTGRETYGAGRYLEIDDPPEPSFVLDFNRAFNPLCNYSPAYNCAIPPRENRLEVAIRAGERTYPH